MTSSESEQVVAPVADQPESIQREKKKRVMSEKQKEAFEKARLKRLENIAKNARSQGGSYSIPSTHTADIPGNRVNPLYQRAEAYRRAHQLPNQICPQVIKDKSR